ncbi:MAG: sigma-70 family RNA polymerase sigma factor [Candidatus Eremiobacteraeota bacterium]|nr:sigma-70 family RNA polymerase sigma factor [Candidatus Eremiobacteraeota bacterium]
MRDGSLEERFARRDATAYESAFHSFGARMQTTALRILRDPEAACECVQDVFEALWRRGSSYSPARGSLEAFLVTCARNAALSSVRAGRRRLESARKLFVTDSYTMEEDPIERERVARALAQLTDGQADVVQRAYYRAMTLTEVAAELAIPIGTVKGRLSAALRALHRSLVVEGSP